MKKLLMLLAIVSLMCVVLTGCMKKTMCFACSKEKYCKTAIIHGRDVPICPDCYEKYELFLD